MELMDLKKITIGPPPLTLRARTARVMCTSWTAFWSAASSLAITMFVVFASNSYLIINLINKNIYA